MNYQTIKIPLNMDVTSERSPRSTWIDIETEKIKIDRWIRETGEAVGLRWNPILIGTGFLHEGRWFVEISFDWSSWTGFVEAMKEDTDLMIYNATREFDEMILKGRFHNARRAHFPEKPDHYPGISEKTFDWLNIRKVAKEKIFERDCDIESKNVPTAWKKGEEKRVFVHLFRDVVGLILQDPDTTVNDISGVIEYLEDYSACEKLFEELEE